MEWVERRQHTHTLNTDPATITIYEALEFRSACN